MKTEQKLKEYPCEWRYNGKLCGSSILATSKEEVQEILDTIGRTKKIVGGHIEEIISAYPGTATYAKFCVLAEPET